ncbi:MAG: 3'(2'),5'-bisphosphate nucleotidase CysQ [Beijerinckiaceae bacterium]
MGGTAGAHGFSLVELERFNAVFCELAVEAGRSIMEAYANPPPVRLKADSSPVSDADEKAEETVLRGLARLLPEFPVVSEEAVAHGAKPEVANLFILVDPLDGTREFIAHNGEFTVNIALIADGQPVLGVVLAPVSGALWCGGRGKAGARFARKAMCQQMHLPLAGFADIGTRRASAGLVGVESRSHRDPLSDAWLAKRGVTQCQQIGSSMKFCLLAEGLADVYPRFAPTMEWDTAAGDAVLRAAGGIVSGEDGQPLLYGKTGFRNGAFVAWGDPDAARRCQCDEESRGGD